MKHMVPPVDRELKMALLATLLPAQRAATVHMMDALREE
jgi:ABC-type lipoprotein release transport system permease subunit